MLADEFKSSQHNGGIEGRESVVTPTNILTEKVISLLEERLVVDLTRRKVGDIVVRKEIETQLVQVQVPIRRETLIVEQVSPEYKRIAQIDLGTEQVDTTAIAQRIEREFSSSAGDKSITVELVGSDRRTIQGRNYSPQAASDLLAELASLPDPDWANIQIEIVLDNSDRQANYQAVLDRHSQL
ncbi:MULTISPECIES: DUF2382 domain-containing protein [unclassified Chamaesiphon]|uniref:DUF2382 domain-containing protein n=1 Tax=unclassified Chamaesiphon TaxID=2620921 RepID=UPI00286A815E|nr:MULTISPECIES: DUF2382 domain-containing protein [unclassified Chamaesiphon]